MTLREASEADVPLLARLNRQLIEDERSPNPMSVAQLDSRIRRWLDANYRAIIFERDSETLAYALFRPDEAGIYLRQFFVCREHRRRGVGRRAFKLLRENVVPPGQSLSLEVLVHNEASLAFWRSLGLREHAMSFRIDS